MQTDEVEKMSSAYAFAEARLCSYEAGKSDNAEQRRLLLRLRRLLDHGRERTSDY